MTDRISVEDLTEARRALNALALEVPPAVWRDVAHKFKPLFDAARLLAVPCETCEGSGRVASAYNHDQTVFVPCSAHCVNGLVPHPDRIELGARAIQSLYNETGATWQEETDKSFYRGAARAVLLADLRHLLGDE